MPPPPAAKPAEPSAGPGKLFRKDVDEVVEGGLGLFLGKVEVEPSVERGVFRGFRIVELRPSEYWQGVDLRPGDVVTQVNGMPIERETQAWNAFQALKQAPRLEVKYLRGGIERELRYEIVGAPSAAPPAGSANTKKSPDAG